MELPFALAVIAYTWANMSILRYNSYVLGNNLHMEADRGNKDQIRWDIL